MSKKLLFLFFLVPVLFACNKSDNTAAEQFTINGIHDVSLSGVGNNILALSVVQSAGAQQQPVTLTATGMPANVIATFSAASGTPTFGTSVTFSQTGAVTPGTYPIKLTGTSASYAKSYDLNITVPALNGYIVDNVTYNANLVSHSYNSGYSRFQVTSGDNGQSTGVTIDYQGTWPTADGTYTYPLDGSVFIAVAFAINNPFTYYSGGTANGNMILKVTGGKMAVTLPPMVLSYSSGSGGSGATKIITVVASE